jgi:hypothetical protein
LFKQIKNIDLGFENCEVMSIDCKSIGHLHIDEIKDSIRRIAVNSVSKMRCCEHFSLSINRNDNISYLPFDQEEWEMNKFERITQSRDIVSVGVHYEDGTSEDFYVPWEGELDYSNECQNTYENEFGDLFLVINKNKKVEDVLNNSEINDKNRMDVIWKMYNY